MTNMDHAEVIALPKKALGMIAGFSIDAALVLLTGCANHPLTDGLAQTDAGPTESHILLHDYPDDSMSPAFHPLTGQLSGNP